MRFIDIDKGISVGQHRVRTDADRSAYSGGTSLFKGIPRAVLVDAPLPLSGDSVIEVGGRMKEYVATRHMRIYAGVADVSYDRRASQFSND